MYTLKMLSSGGKYPAGIDKTYGHHVLYPGVLAFYRELDESRDVENGVGNMVFLSARPHFYKDIAEKGSYSKFNKLYRNSRKHFNRLRGRGSSNVSQSEDGSEMGDDDQDPEGPEDASGELARLNSYVNLEEAARDGGHGAEAGLTPTKHSSSSASSFSSSSSTARRSGGGGRW